MNTAIIQVIVGVLFVYILLSLLVSQINQVIAYVLNIRAEQLRKRIGEIVVDSSVQRQILSHPLVGLVSNSTKGSNSQAFISNRTAQISQVASSSFAKAMVNIFTDPYLELYSAIALVRNDEERNNLEEIVTQLRANANDPTRSVAVLNHLHEKINQLTPPDRKDRKALLRSLGSVSAALRSIQSGNSRLFQLLQWGQSRGKSRLSTGDGFHFGACARCASGRSSDRGVVHEQDGSDEKRVRHDHASSFVGGGNLLGDCAQY
jgi:hypothetical protein